jgi:hypothetical protein
MNGPVTTPEVVLIVLLVRGVEELLRSILQLFL